MAEAQNRPKTCPSRAFLVQQATLTALELAYPLSIRRHGRAVEAWRVFRICREGFTEGFEFKALVGAEFARLASRYSAQVAA